jgi:hypothetical protein
MALLALVVVAGMAAATEEDGWIRISAGPVIIEAPASQRGEAERLAAVASRVLPQLERSLGVRARAPFRIFVLPAGGELPPELALLDDAAPVWASGFLIGRYRVGAIRLDQVRRYPTDDAPEVLAHELTHMLLWDAALDALPRWFGEGVATREGRRWGLRDFIVTSRTVLAREPPRLAELDADFEATSARARRAYAVSFAFVSWSVDAYGEDLVPHILDLVEGGRTFDEAWLVASGDALEDAERRWRRRSVWFYRWLPMLASSGTLWIAISLLAVLAGLAKRRRRRALHARWEAEDRAREELAAAPAPAEPSDPSQWVN